MMLSANVWLGIQKNRDVDITKISKTVGAPASENLSKKIARDAITLLENNDRALPIGRDKSLKVAVVVLSDIPNREYGREFISLLQEKYSALTVSYINGSTADDAISAALRNGKR